LLIEHDEINAVFFFSAWRQKEKENSWDATPVTTDIIWLPGLEPGFYDCPYVGNVIIPTDSYIFSEG